MAIEAPQRRDTRFHSRGLANVVGLPDSFLHTYHPLELTAVDPNEYAEVESKHFALGRRTILDAATLAIKKAKPEGKKKALILGSGFCLDIPIEELTAMYDEVTLVDFFPNRTRDALTQRLEPGQQEKVRLIKADLTGYTIPIVNALHEAEADAENYLRYMTRVGKVYQKSMGQHAPPDLGSDYTFVSSHMVASQLNRVPIEYVNAVTEDHGHALFKKDEMFFESNAYRQLVLFDEIIQEDHQGLLRRSVRSDGIVHFADSTVGENVLFEQFSDPYFERKKTKHWKWAMGEKTDNYWDVQAYTLTPRNIL